MSVRAVCMHVCVHACMHQCMYVIGREDLRVGIAMKVDRGHLLQLSWPTMLLGALVARQAILSGDAQAVVRG